MKSIGYVAAALCLSALRSSRATAGGNPDAFGHGK
jgi:hypothetical protein